MLPPSLFDIEFGLKKRGRLKKAAIFPIIDSTSTYLKEHPEIDVVYAIKQTAGHGRFGREYSSEPGGIYFSFRASPKHYKLATVAAAVAVSNAIRKHFEIETNIKWVNDILIDGKKVAGILAESCLPQSLIIGIGINARNKLPKELSARATRIEDYADTDIDVGKFVVDIIVNFENLLCLPKKKLIEEYKRRMTYFNEPIYATGKNGSMRTVIPLDVDLNGNLVVQEKDGTVTKLSSGEVSTRI